MDTNITEKLGGRLVLGLVALIIAPSCMMEEPCAEGDQQCLADQESAAQEEEIVASSQYGVYTPKNGISIINGVNLANGFKLENGVNLANGVDFKNGLDFKNGVDLRNGININGCQGPCMSPLEEVGLDQWLDGKGSMGRKIVQYMTECALGPGQYMRIKTGGTTYSYQGIAGLAPYWTGGVGNGMISPYDQEKVSACLLARVNGSGNTVTILLNSANFDSDPNTPDMTELSNSEYASFPKREAAFFGNAFIQDTNSSNPPVYACAGNNTGYQDTTAICSSRMCSGSMACKNCSNGRCECGPVKVGWYCGNWSYQGSNDGAYGCQTLNPGGDSTWSTCSNPGASSCREMFRGCSADGHNYGSYVFTARTP